MITTRSLLCYGSIPSKANLCVFGNTKLDQGEDRLTQTLVFPSSHIYTEKYMVPKPFKKCYDGKCSHSTFFSMPQAKTITDNSV